MLLCPQEEWLYGFYRGRGYTHTINRAEIPDISQYGGKSLPYTVCAAEQAAQIRADALARLSAAVQIPPAHMDMAIYDARFGGGEIWRIGGGYAVAVPKGDCLITREIISADSPAGDILETLKNIYPSKKITVQGAVIGRRIIGNEIKPYGLMKPLDGELIPQTEIYMNLMLN